MESKLKKIIITILRIIHIPASDSFVITIVQFVKFGIVGVSNTLLSYVLNVLVLLLLGPFQFSWDYFVGNIVSFLLSVLWSFYWNNKYVFKTERGEKRSIGKALLKTYISYGVTGIVLNNILSYIWIDLLSISKYIAPLINLVLSVPINFFMNKFWAFKNK